MVIDSLGWRNQNSCAFGPEPRRRELAGQRQSQLHAERRSLAGRRARRACSAPLKRSNGVYFYATAGLRSSPSAAMRDASVVGFIPSSSAAPSGPKIFPPVCCSAAMRLLRVPAQAEHLFRSNLNARSGNLNADSGNLNTCSGDGEQPFREGEHRFRSR